MHHNQQPNQSRGGETGGIYKLKANKLGLTFKKKEKIAM